MKTLSSLAAIAALAFSISSCDPEPLVTPDTPSSNGGMPYQSIEEVLDELAPPVQQFSFDASSGGTFTTPRGSEIIFPPQALLDGNGQTVTGSVTLSFQEIFTPMDIMASGVYTISNGDILNSGGAYNIEVSQNGAQLQLNPSNTVSVSIPQQAQDPAMQIFVGDSLGSGSNNSWQLPDTASSGTGTPNIYNLISQNNIYQIIQNNLGWINCDAFSNIGMAEPIHFDLLGNNGFSSVNTLVWGHVTSMNSVYQILPGANATFMNSQMRNYRVGNANTTVVALGYVGNQLYFGYTNITPVAGTTYPIQMTAISMADFQAFIASL